MIKTGPRHCRAYRVTLRLFGRATPPYLRAQVDSNEAGGRSVAGSKQRERELARQRWERQQRARAESKRRSRRRQQMMGSVLAVLVIIGGIFFLFKPFSNDKSSSASES